jgi:membrane dipeptidase
LITIDTCGPEGPAVYTPEILEALEACGTAGEALETITSMTHALLLRDELPGFWSEWRRSGVDVSCLTIGVGWGDEPFTYDAAINDIAAYKALFNAGKLACVRCPDEALRAKEAGTPGIVLAFQNTTHFADSLVRLEQFAELGVKIMQLTYNTRNLIGDGCMEHDPKGLTAFGKRAVRRMNELGVVVDLSHVSERTSFDAVKTSDKPVAITHAMARDVYAHDRAKTDEMIKAVGTDGYVGVVAVPFFLTDEEPATIEHFVRHVDHIVELIGTDHVGIGTDWSPEFTPKLIELQNAEIANLGFREEHQVDFGAKIEGIDAWADWPKLLHGLREHGYSPSEVEGIAGGNFLRLFGEVTASPSS